MIHQEDTICATATAPGGAIGIIRISGPEAIAITSRIFTPSQGAPLEDRKPHTITFGTINDTDGETIDEVLVSLFRAPHSYTGEDSTEISCHGSSYILGRVLQLLVAHGCRLARPGEYTQRAFLNGKMDLSQAEAVADLIASSSSSAHRLAMNQMRGGFSRELTLLRDRLLHFTSLIELELDFSDHEELEFADRTELCRLADEIESTLSKLASSFRVGNAIKNGIPVAIVGETNAGKSTLLNALLGEERAIVSPIHGTTRDVIEDTTVLGGITFRFIDTAGIRQTADTIETLGIERTFHKLEQAEIVLWMVDATEASKQIAQLAPSLLPRCEGKQVILLINKTDLPHEKIVFNEELRMMNEELGAKNEILGIEHKTTKLNTDSSSPVHPSSKEDSSFFIHHSSLKILSLSAKDRTNIEVLQQMLINAANLPSVTQAEVIVTNARHYEALIHALDSIHRVQQGLSTDLSGDFVAQDIRECIFHLSDIVGEVTTDDVLGNIFKHFCVGK